jgi:hypothetical protein
VTSLFLDRLIEPKDEDILYHYCSASTFKAICETKTVRFSDINMMNDSSEMRYSYNIFEESASILINNEFPLVGKIGKGFFDKVDEVISPQQLVLHPVIACFSLTPDLLSQWERYGSRGSGFCIGISAKALKALPATMGKVLYDRKKQIEEMRNALCAIFLQNKEKGCSYGSAFRTSCALLAAEMALLKHPSFSEECEVRLIHVLDVHYSDDTLWLSDEGGESEGAEVRGEKVCFRVVEESFVAYIDIHFSGTYKQSFLQEVILGPKNQNGPGNLLYLTGNSGLKPPKLRLSGCPYR